MQALLLIVLLLSPLSVSADQLPAQMQAILDSKPIDTSQAATPGPDQMKLGTNVATAQQDIGITYYTAELTTFNDTQCANGPCQNSIPGIAHRSWPLGSCVAVCAISSKRCATAVVMDRGPAEYLTRRTIDADPALTQILKLSGVDPATYRLISTSGDCPTGLAGGDLNPVNGLPASVTAQPAIIGTPYQIGTPMYQTGSGAGQVLTQPYYCVVNLDPVVVWPLSAGTVFPNYCYNAPPSTSASYQTIPLPPQPQAQPFSAPVQSLASNNAIQTLASPGAPLYATSSIPAQILGNLQTVNSRPYSAQLLVESTSLQRGNPVVLVWSSVGMSAASQCIVSEGAATLTQSNEGSQTIPTDAATPNILNFTLQCTSLSGASVQKTASVNFH